MRTFRVRDLLPDKKDWPRQDEAIRNVIAQGEAAMVEIMEELAAPTQKRERKPKRRTDDDLPLFASDEKISEVLMGPGKTREWLAIVPLLEQRGFPSINGLMGGRYIPAVKAFFDREYKVHGELQFREPHRKAELGSWRGKRHPD
jgi:hypothetical protein